MQQLSIAKIKEFIRWVAVAEQQPVFIWGQPGVGKSEGIAQLVHELETRHLNWVQKLTWVVAQKLGLKGSMLCDIRLSQYDSVDLRGFPGLDAETHLTRWHAPSTLPFVGNNAFPDDKLIILFLDECNSANQAVAAVAYQLVNERRVGEHILKPNVVVVAAGNREGDRGVTNRQPLPLSNRFTHAEAVLSVDDFCYWGAETGKVPNEGIAFLQFRKNLLSTFKDVVEKPELGKAFATPRTWVKAFGYWNNPDMPEDIKLAAMEGAVGQGPVNEFYGFIKVWKNITPIREIIKNPEKVKLPEDAAMKYATAINVSGHLGQPPHDKATKEETKAALAALHKFLRRLDPEFAVMAWQLAVKRDSKLHSTDEFVQFARDSKAIYT